MSLKIVCLVVEFLVNWRRLRFDFRDEASWELIGSLACKPLTAKVNTKFLH